MHENLNSTPAMLHEPNPEPYTGRCRARRLGISDSDFRGIKNFFQAEPAAVSVNHTSGTITRSAFGF